MKVVLIGNYQPDKQESMKLFSIMLHNGFTNAGIKSEIWLPTVFFGTFAKSTTNGIGKWLGYLDKWILFPFILWYRAHQKNYNNAATIFHICDHSNAPYLTSLPSESRAITCHDVLAIRGALGFQDAFCEASRFGVILQKRILKSLLKATKLASVSGLTLRQLKELNNGSTSPGNDWRVIPNAFNKDFRPIPASDCTPRLKQMGIPGDVPFILHLGSALKRKNRKLLVDMLVALGDAWNGIVCFAGSPIDPELASYINELGLQHRVKSIVKPSHDNVLVLYSSCEAFVFPSYSEGFGWPVIEAQACGAVVIASNIEPMPEVSGGAALHESPHDAVAFSKAFLNLKDQSLRERLIAQGFENSKRFSVQQMIDSYLSLFNHKKPLNIHDA